MFSTRITNSARFLKMTPSAQNLYFHLCLNADDDGIVEAFRIILLLNNSEDDLKALIGRNFIKVLNEDLVSLILDWKEHNLIRADRKVNSIYKDLLVRVLPDFEILEPKPRADTGVIPRQNTTGRPVDDNWTAQVRLGEVREGNICVPKETLQELNSVNDEIQYVDEYQKEGLKEHNQLKQSTDDFFDYYDQEYVKYVSDVPYKYSKRSPKLRKLVQSKAKQFNGFEHLKELLDLYFERDDKFTKSRAYGLEFFLVNQTLNELNQL